MAEEPGSYSFCELSYFANKDDSDTDTTDELKLAILFNGEMATQMSGIWYVYHISDLSQTSSTMNRPQPSCPNISTVMVVSCNVSSSCVNV